MGFLILLLTQFTFAQTSTRTEVQVNICESMATLTEKLQLSAWKAKASQKSYLIDTKSLQLYASDLVFKVKLNPSTEEAEITLKHNQILNGQKTQATSADCEYDLHGTQKKLACKLSNVLTMNEFLRFVDNQDYLALLNSEQLAWLNELQIQIPPDLQMTFAFHDQDYTSKLQNYKITLGVTKNQRQNEFTEISIRTAENDEIQAQRELLTYLKSKNVHICADQNSIFTRLKLESFFKQ